MMEKNLLFAKVKLKSKSKEKNTNFFLLIFLILMCCTPHQFKASALNGVDAEVTPAEAVLYISGDAQVYNISSISNAVVVVEKTTIPSNFAENKVLTSTRHSTSTKVAVKLKTKKIETPYSPKQTIKSIPARDKFSAGSSSGNDNSVLTNQFTSNNVVVAHFNELMIPSFAFLLKIYSSDFSKTAALSCSCFSRPPPSFSLGA